MLRNRTHLTRLLVVLFLLVTAIPAVPASAECEKYMCQRGVDTATCLLVFGPIRLS